MKKLISIPLLMLLTLSCAGQHVESQPFDWMLRTMLDHSVDKMSVDRLAAAGDELIMLDARTSEEYAVSHIPDALLVGYEAFDLQQVDHLDRNQPIVVYCSVGYRSEKIAKRLKEEGFTKVWNLYGGIFEWKNRGYEVVDGAGPTERVHAYSRTWGVWLQEGEKVYTPGD